MTSTSHDDRISVANQGERANVVIDLGEVTVTVTQPTTPVLRRLTPERLRITLIANARRALEMARSELE